MEKHGPNLSKVVVAAALVVLATTGVSLAAPSASSTPAFHQPAAAPLVQLAQSSGRELQPRYEPAPPPQKSSYNDQYIFGITRGVADSTMDPVLKIFIFPITVPFDIVFFPFEVMAGFF